MKTCHKRWRVVVLVLVVYNNENRNSMSVPVMPVYLQYHFASAIGLPTILGFPLGSLRLL
jgi:hypothetical protein